VKKYQKETDMDIEIHIVDGKSIKVKGATSFCQTEGFLWVLDSKGQCLAAANSGLIRCVLTNAASVDPLPTKRSKK
jgi:hypothetical protein